MFHDYTLPGRHYHFTNTFSIGRNKPPQLIDPTVSPLTGGDTTLFHFQVTYIDSDNNLPTVRKLYIDGSSYEMAAYDHQYSDSALFTYSLNGFDPGQHHFYFLFSDGQKEVSTTVDSFRVTGLEDREERPDIPQAFCLYQNYPNPFNSTTAISYQLSAVRPHHTTLKIYNILGQKIRTLVDEKQPPGNYSILWDGKDENGRPVSSGIYFYRLKAGNFCQVRKMVLLR